MRILLLRHDDDGSIHWNTYEDFYDMDDQLLLTDIRAHLNTVGVRKLEIIPSTATRCESQASLAPEG